MAANKVISGDYCGCTITHSFNTAWIEIPPKDIIAITDRNIETYSVVDEQYNKSAVGVVGRAALGAAVLGPVGLLAGATAKNKGTHILILVFKDGKKSLVEVNDKIYKSIITGCF